MVFTQEQIEDFACQGFVIKANGVFGKYRGQEAHVEIPEGVTEISERAFHDCSSLESVVIPKGVTVISRVTFAGCSSLASVVIPEGVTKIEERAFNGCSSLSSVVIPDSVTVIGSCAFYYNKRLQRKFKYSCH